MSIRAADADDADRIREVAERSFAASYSLSPSEIETILEVEFAPDPLAQRIGGDDAVLFVAERDDETVGFAEGRVRDEGDGEVVWLHVHPYARGEGLGTSLFEHATDELRDRETSRLRAVVHAQNEEGSEFFDRFDFESAGTEQRQIGDHRFRFDVFTDSPGAPETADVDDGEPTMPDDERITVEGEERYVDPDDEIPGDQAPFYGVYEAADRDDRYGFYCSNCGTFTGSVDGLGTIVCEECGNVHRPDEWDASYL